MDWARHVQNRGVKVKVGDYGRVNKRRFEYTSKLMINKPISIVTGGYYGIAGEGWVKAITENEFLITNYNDLDHDCNLNCNCKAGWFHKDVYFLTKIQEKG